MVGLINSKRTKNIGLWELMDLHGMILNLNAGFYVHSTVYVFSLLNSYLFRIEDPPNSHLAVFENRAEMDCIIKYLIDEYPANDDI